MAPRVKQKRGGWGGTSEVRTLPNLLTLLRIVSIPAVLFYIDNESALRSFVACLLFMLAAVTDFLDGYLARRQRKVSLLGQFLDPLADKILVMATLVWMVPLGRIDGWVVILLLARELAVTTLRGIASAQGLVIAARPLGKEKTALQLVGIACLILHFRYRLLFTDLYVDFQRVGMHTIYFSLVLSIFSAVDYLLHFSRALDQPHQ
ncbi:MAG: CDP-diacylglycerol--glycerol-3-phosphate 3-phosphatidyltransferase [Proteobacteria bacterium]|nr:CDP-diacylglycerol--glycerol-3-phosphate 3-phosphatidyltransferase [Pseudomonadota bacterium]